MRAVVKSILGDIPASDLADRLLHPQNWDREGQRIADVDYAMATVTTGEAWGWHVFSAQGACVIRNSMAIADTVRFQQSRSSEAALETLLKKENP